MYGMKHVAVTGKWPLSKVQLYFHIDLPLSSLAGSQAWAEE